jgi:hypothetical protein
MTSNPESIVQQRPHEVQHLLTAVTGPDARAQTAYTVELTRFRRRLALGAALLRRFCVTRAAVRPAEPVTAPDGTRLIDHDQRPTLYSSVCGNVRCWRHCFTAPGPHGSGPLDAELSVPARGSADLLRAWAAYGTADASSRASPTVRARLLGLSLRVHALERGVTEAGAEVSACSEPPTDPSAAASSGTLLVVPAEGQGVPLVQPPAQTRPVRLGTGQQRGTQPAAVVTGLYTSAPSPRPPQAVVAALLPEAGGPEPAARPRPAGQARRATRAGKAVARRRLAPRLAQRAGPPIQPRVARTDGAQALQPRWVAHVPGDTWVLDLIQAVAELWDTANALLGATHPPRVAWVRADLEPRLAGPIDAVVTALAAAAQDPAHTATPRQAVRRTIGDDQRHRPYRRDAEDRARGWPIGTGVIEGACGPLVQERLEPSGMRWTNAGAQAGLDLRAVRLNDHGDRDGQFPRQPHHHRLSGPSVPVPEQAEDRALEWAA